jgi:hypothetical protein
MLITMTLTLSVAIDTIKTRPDQRRRSTASCAWEARLRRVSNQLPPQRMLRHRRGRAREMPLWVHKAGREARHGCVDVWHDDSCRPGPWAIRKGGPDGRSVVSQCHLSSGAAERGLADCLHVSAARLPHARCPSANHRATPIAQAHTHAHTHARVVVVVVVLVAAAAAAAAAADDDDDALAAVQPAVASLLHSAQ